MFISIPMIYLEKKSQVFISVVASNLLDLTNNFELSEVEILKKVHSYKS